MQLHDTYSLTQNKIPPLKWVFCDKLNNSTCRKYREYQKCRENATCDNICIYGSLYRKIVLFLAKKHNMSVRICCKFNRAI